MSSHFLVFGSHPRLSLCEAKFVLGGRAPRVVGPVAIMEADAWGGAWLQERLAGTIKLGDVLFSCSLKELTAEKIVEALPIREGTSKLTFAITSYGSGGALKRLPIEVKKALKDSGRSVRWFADETGHVSPAAIAKLRLTTEGYDLIVAVDHETVYVGLTTHVQNADAWSLRDYGRPARDTRNGMLPPKLARMMVNLALGARSIEYQVSSIENTDSVSAPHTRYLILDTRYFLLDPFCGSGTVLMEAALMGQQTVLIGSDIDAKQITDTQNNLDWMVEHRLISSEQRVKIRCFPHDVRTLPNFIHEPVDLIVTEGFLGTPLRGHETLTQLEREVRAVTKLWRDTLEALAKIQPRGGVIVAVWPIFKVAHGEAKIDLPQEVARYGYEMVDPLAGWMKEATELVYARADQHVKRRIVILRRK